MKRLTSNKPVSEMGIVELAHNSCYRNIDGRARYRDYDIDIDAIELTRRLLKDHADGDDAFTDNEDFGDQMMDYLQDGMDSMEGLISLFYRNLWAMADLRERLKYYEDLEEQGKLLRLPCKPEDKLYWISDPDEDAGFTYEPIEEVEICNIDYNGYYNGYSLQLWFADEGEKRFPVLKASSIGKELFYSQEEAEAALKELRRGVEKYKQI